MTYDALSKLSGASFDKEFMDYNVSDHEGDMKDFQEQSEKGTDQNVKAFAASNRRENLDQNALNFLAYDEE